MLNKIDIKYWTDFAYQVLYDKWMYNYYINRDIHSVFHYELQSTKTIK